MQQHDTACHATARHSMHFQMADVCLCMCAGPMASGLQQHDTACTLKWLMFVCACVQVPLTLGMPFWT